MTRNEINVYLAAILSTLLECGGSPESMIYIALGMDLPKYEMIRGILKDAALIEVRGNYVTLTEKGKTLAEKVNAATAKPV